MKEQKSAAALAVEAASNKLNVAAKKEGLGELERELIRRGFLTSRTQLSNALNGKTDTLKTEILLECMDIGFDEDWNKARRFMKRA